MRVKKKMTKGRGGPRLRHPVRLHPAYAYIYIYIYIIYIHIYIYIYIHTYVEGLVISGCCT